MCFVPCQREEEEPEESDSEESSDDDGSFLDDLQSNEPSLEEARQRMHELVDNAFALISPRYRSVAMTSERCNTINTIDKWKSSENRVENL